MQQLCHWSFQASLEAVWQTGAVANLRWPSSGIGNTAADPRPGLRCGTGWNQFCRYEADAFRWSKPSTAFYSYDAPDSRPIELSKLKISLRGNRTWLLARKNLSSSKFPTVQFNLKFIYKWRCSLRFECVHRSFGIECFQIVRWVNTWMRRPTKTRTTFVPFTGKWNRSSQEESTCRSVSVAILLCAEFYYDLNIIDFNFSKRSIVWCKRRRLNIEADQNNSNVWWNS